MIKFHCYPDTDSLYIDLAERPSADSREVAPGVVLDFDAGGHLVGIDVDNASKTLDLSKMETASSEGLEIYLSSASALAKGWLRPKEDEAWRHL